MQSHQIKRLLKNFFFVGALSFLPLVTEVHPYHGLNWLSVGPAPVQAGPESEGLNLPASQLPDQVEPGQGKAGVFDPQTPDIRLDFEVGSVSVPVEVRVFKEELPANVPPPAESVVGSPFFLGVWIRGQGMTVTEFNPPLVINVKYRGFIPETTPSSIPAGQLHLMMYDSATQAWITLCSRDDGAVVSAALAWPTPLEKNGNALFALTTDTTPALEGIDNQGATAFSIPGSSARLNVVADTAAPGTYYEVTLLSKAPDSGLVKLLPTPIDIKACLADYQTPNAIRQITQFPKLMTIEFGYDEDTLTRAGSQANLTIATLQNGQWVDLAELGYRVGRGASQRSLATDRLGSFSLAVR
jgi:hypothetical protein